MGEVILTQIAEHANVPTDEVNLSIGFPSLIYHICIDMHPEFVRLDVRYAPSPRRLMCDHKLFKGKHVGDILAREKEVVMRQPRKSDMGLKGLAHHP